MPKLITFDFDRPNVIENQSLFLTLLTHPREMLSKAIEGGSKDEQTAWRVHHSICIAAYLAKAEIDPEWANSSQLKPYWLGIPLEERCLQSLPELWRRGLIAGRVALVFIDQTLTGELPDALRGVRRLTLDSVCDLLGTQTGLGDAHNFENRIWRLYRPVVHLFAAAQRLIELSDRDGEVKITMGHVVTDATFVSALIRKAEEFEKTLIQSPFARLSEESLLQVRLAA